MLLLGVLFLVASALSLPADLLSREPVIEYLAPLEYSDVGLHSNSPSVILEELNDEQKKENEHKDDPSIIPDAPILPPLEFSLIADSEKELENHIEESEHNEEEHEHSEDEVEKPEENYEEEKEEEEHKDDVSKPVKIKLEILKEPIVKFWSSLPSLPSIPSLPSLPSFPSFPFSLPSFPFYLPSFPFSYPNIPVSSVPVISSTVSRPPTSGETAAYREVYIPVSLYHNSL